MVDEEVTSKKLEPMAEEMIMLIEVLKRNFIFPSDSHPLVIITKNMSAVIDNLPQVEFADMEGRMQELMEEFKKSKKNAFFLLDKFVRNLWVCLMQWAGAEAGAGAGVVALKFTPKPPSRRKLVLPKSDSDDDNEEDAKIARELFRKANIFLETASQFVTDAATEHGNDKSRYELKAKTTAEDVIAPHGAGSSSTTDELKDKKNSSNLGYAPEKMVTRSSSIVAKDEVTETMLVDAESGYSSNSDNEYKEPWVRYGSINYDSYYPITLPLRRPCSVNPEVLDAQEFGEEKEYVETKMNTASKIGLSENNEEKQMIFFQFPEILPLDKKTNRVPISSKGKEKVESSTSVREKASNKCPFKDLPSGYMGKMLVYKSGAVKLKLGDIFFDVSPGIIGECKQDAAMFNTKAGHCCVLGSIDKKGVVTPDVDSLLDNINNI
ncbi:DNA-directed RNA polymerase III subunit RPC4 isoform X1 [Tanacetum coccineum]